MRVWCLTIVLMGAFFSVMPADADVDIQYALPPVDCATGGCHITGVTDTATNPPFDSTPGFGIVTLTGVTLAQVVWPVPAGCSVGHQTWTRLTDPNNVTAAGGGMALRPGLIFFSTTSPLLTGCHSVSSWRQLRNLMNQGIISSIGDEVGVVGALNYHFVWYDGRCRGSETNANCISWKANLDQMVTAYPSRGQGITASGDVATLINDAMAFKAAQCAAGVSSFC